MLAKVMQWIKFLLDSRWAYFVIFLTVTALLGYGFYLEFYESFVPCPLCTSQRLCFALVGICGLLGLFIYPFHALRQLTNLLIVGFSVSGFALAARQTWLQMYPTAHSTECGVSVAYMMNILPWHEVAAKILAGTGECSKKTWEFLSLTMPEWAMIWFALFFLVGAALLTRSIIIKK